MGKINFNKVPKNIRCKLDKIPSNQIVVACAKIFSLKDLVEGKLSHLGVVVDGGQLSFHEKVLAPTEAGKYSRRNLEGRTIIREDLPMETYSWSIEAPDWQGYGTHSVDFTRERYQREFEAPSFCEICLAVLRAEPEKGQYVLKFEISELLDKQQVDFEDRLLYCLNIMQENIGDCGVEQTDKADDEYLKTLHVSWEILPPGSREEAISRLFKERVVTQQERREVEDRYDFFVSLEPAQVVLGTSGLARYLGAVVKDDLVVFDNMEYGNALYIMFEDWVSLSQKTRTELLSGKYGKNFERVLHTKEWKERVRERIKKKIA